MDLHTNYGSDAYKITMNLGRFGIGIPSSRLEHSDDVVLSDLISIITRLDGCHGYDRDEKSGPPYWTLANRMLLEDKYGIVFPEEYNTESWQAMQDYFAEHTAQLTKMKKKLAANVFDESIGKYSDNLYMTKRILRHFYEPESDPDPEDNSGEGEGEGESDDSGGGTIGDATVDTSSPNYQKAVRKHYHEDSPADGSFIRDATSGGKHLDVDKVISFIDPQILPGTGVRSVSSWRMPRKSIHHLYPDVMLPSYDDGRESAYDSGGCMSYAVCCDTSGSVSGEMISTFAKVCNLLAAEDHDIVFVSCASRYSVASKDDVLSMRGKWMPDRRLGSGNGDVPGVDHCVCEGYQAQLGVNKAVRDGLLDHYPDRVLLLTDGGTFLARSGLPGGDESLVGSWRVISESGKLYDLRPGMVMPLVRGVDEFYSSTVGGVGCVLFE